MFKKVMEIINQNKNIIMLVVTFFYIFALIGFFHDAIIVVSVIFSIFIIICVLKDYLNKNLILFMILIFYFGYVNCSYNIKANDALYKLAPSTQTLSGQIITIPSSASKTKTKFMFKTDKGKTLVTIKNKSNNIQELNIGNYYTIKGKLRQPFNAENPSQFDYSKYLKNFNIFTTFYANDADITFNHKPTTIQWIVLQKLNDLRKDILATHSKYLKNPNLEILGGIVFGDDAIEPPQDIKRCFINSGLLHILAASGMNVAFIYGFWFLFLSYFKVPYKITITTGMLMVLLYCLMTGLSPSVIRATIMIIFILTGKLLNRNANSVSLLALVALLMLVYNPAYINDISFQLSFVVTLGILLSADLFVKKIGKIPIFVSSTILVPVIAQIWVAPIQMFYFNTFSLYSVFANIAITPFLMIISFGGFISSILSIIKPISEVVCKSFDFVLNFFLNVLVYISKFFASLPHSIVTMPEPTCIQIVLYYSIILFITLLIKQSFKNKKLFVLTLFLTIVLVATNIRLPNNNCEVLVFSLGNANSALIKSPNNKYFLVDTGKSACNGTSSQAKYIILEYLKDNYIKDIEGLIVTHFDNDHSGGVLDILENLNVKHVYINTLNAKTQIAKDIYAHLKDYTVVEGKKEIYAEPGFKITVLKPNFGEKYGNNENSVITLLSRDKTDMLFMGDAGVKAFNNIKPKLPTDIEILMLGHHGAKDVINDEMLRFLHTKDAIISTGRNKYGHPHFFTLSVLEQNKINVLRTDKSYAIKLILNKDNYKFRTFKKKKCKLNINKKDKNPYK